MSKERITWMRSANELLLKAGISDNLVSAAREAFLAGMTPEQFYEAVADQFVAHSMNRYLDRGRSLAPIRWVERAIVQK